MSNNLFFKFIGHNSFFKCISCLQVLSVTLCLFILCLSNLTYAKDIKAILNDIKEDDRQDLYEIFYRMMNKDHFVYTLFGDKPVSSSSDFILTPSENIFCGMKCGGIFWRKWEVWKKYKALFSMNHYLLIECPSVENIKSFINKEAFLQVVNQNLDLFKEILGKNTNASNLLRKIEEDQNFFSTIKENQMLFGLLLGYGKHNSKLFFDRDNIRQFIKSKKLPKLPYKVPLPSKEFSSLLEEHDFFHSKLLPFEKYSYSLLFIKPIHFMADLKHPETIKLQKKYQELRRKISILYAQSNFLEITLSQLIVD